MGRKKNLVKNTFIFGLAKASTQLISFLLLPLYTSYLSPKDYGIIDLSLTYALLFAPIITVQLEASAFRFLIDSRGNVIKISTVITNVFFSITPIVFFALICSLVINWLYSIQYLTLISLVTASIIYSNIFLQFARGLGMNKKFAIGSIIAGFVTILSNIILIVLFHKGISGVLWSIVFANIVCSIYLIISLKLYRYIKIGLLDSTERKKYIRYSLPLVPNGVSSWIIDVSDRTIVFIVLGLASSGIYAIANKFSVLFNGIFYVYNLSWSESASMHVDDDDHNRYFSDIVNKATLFFSSFGLILIACIPMVFPFLINIRFENSYYYIPILITASFFNSIAGQYGSIYVAKKQTRKLMNITVIAGLLNIVINIALIKFIGIYAAAISTAIAYLIMAVYRHYDVKKYVSIKYEKNIFIKISILYVFTMTLYYIDNVILNILNIIVITIVAIILNKSNIKVIKNKVLSINYRKRNKLTIEQEIYEESL